jgi:hypothetical protein
MTKEIPPFEIIKISCKNQDTCDDYIEPRFTMLTSTRGPIDITTYKHPSESRSSKLPPYIFYFIQE